MSKGLAVGGRAEADLGREVPAEQRGVPEAGMLCDLLDRELRRFQEAAGEQYSLRDELAVRRCAGAGPELAVEGPAAHRGGVGDLADGGVLWQMFERPA